jgi:hypothetical protein
MVKIELYKGENIHSIIADSTFSDGQFPWNIPFNSQPGIDYKIKIKSIENNNILDFSDQYFTIYGNEITINSPNGGESWRSGTTHDILWLDNVNDMVILKLYKSDTLYSIIDSSTFSDGQFPWRIPTSIEPGDDYKVSVSSLDDPALIDLSDSSFSLYRSEITVMSPNGSETWKSGSSYDITWSDNIGAMVIIELYKDDKFYSVIDSSTFSDGQIPWDIPASIDTSSDYKIKLTSVNDSTIYDYSDSAFTIYRVPDMFVLYQNYPNPFNSSTKIKYGIPKDKKVLLEVFDILGQRISKLVDNEQKAGYYEISFSVNGLASGIYLFRIVAGDYIKMKKMVLLK